MIGFFGHFINSLNVFGKVNVLVLALLLCLICNGLTLFVVFCPSKDELVVVVAVVVVILDDLEEVAIVLDAVEAECCALWLDDV